MVIVVNRRCDVSNAISSEISMDRKLAWVENCTGNYTAVISACIASDLGLFEGVMLARNKCPTVNSACAAVISACNFL